MQPSYASRKISEFFLHAALSEENAGWNQADDAFVAILSSKSLYSTQKKKARLARESSYRPEIEKAHAWFATHSANRARARASD